MDRAPSREALRGMSPQRILEALEFGPMAGNVVLGFSVDGK